MVSTSVRQIAPDFHSIEGAQSLGIPFVKVKTLEQSYSGHAFPNSY